jgi:hypothetical protein
MIHKDGDDIDYEGDIFITESIVEPVIKYLLMKIGIS